MKLITTFSGLFAVLAVALGVYFLFQNANQPISHNLTQDGFHIQLTYSESYEWEYNLTGSLPNPCYSLDVLTDASNSQKEETQILVYINPPLPEEICTLVIQEITTSGSFSGQETDTFSLSIVQNEIIDTGTSDLEAIPEYDFDTAQEITKEDYVLKYVYDRSNSVWGYIVNGTLPNECYQAEVSTNVNDSLPETVVLSLNITEPEDGLICTQVIQDLQLTGELSAASDAQFQFDVN